MKYFLILLSIIVCTSCQNETNESPKVSSDIIDPESPPEMTSEEPIFDFGTIVKGEKITHKFIFTNTGDSKLLISNVITQCGCTTPNKWPKEAILPGERGEIEIHFDSDEVSGTDIKKEIKVAANTEPGTNLFYIKGKIILPEKNDN